MSHWTKIKLKVTDEEILAKALKRMGFEAVTGNFTVSQYGTSEKATIRIDEAVGFAKQGDGTFAMVGDFYHARGKARTYYNGNDKFQRELNVAYAIEDATAKLAGTEWGFEISENAEAVVGKDGMIRMVATSWS